MLVKNEKYLPIGSVVATKKTKIKLMIIGYNESINVDKLKENDYIACVFPQGMMNLKDIYSFKHEQIDEIYWLGYNNEETEVINSILKIKSMDGVNNE